MRNVARFILSIGLSVGVLLASTPMALAQQPNEQPQIKITQVDNSKFPQVTVYVSVTNAKGEPVGVDPSTIQIAENGQAMQPTGVAGGAGGQGGPGPGPLTTMLVMDVSGSMNQNGKIDGAKAAAKAYVDQMRPSDQTGLMTFDTKVTYVQQITTDHNALLQAIDGIKTHTDTAMYDALIAAEEALKGVSGRKAIIAVTDGMDNRSTHSVSDVISGTQQNSLSISTIGLGDPNTNNLAGLDETALKSLADQAGGTYSYAGDPKGLAALFQQYARTLQSEYAITYLSPSKLRDGINRNLTVSLTMPGAAASTVKTNYNPGGVLPEVGGQSWLLFGGILVGLLVLLFVPILIGMLGRAGSLGGGKKKSRVKLAGEPTSQPVAAARPRVKMK